jgi:hypothetical protein
MPIFLARVIVPARASSVPSGVVNPVSGAFGLFFAYECGIPFTGLAKAYFARQETVPPLVAFIPVSETFDLDFAHEPFPPFAVIARARSSLPPARFQGAK